MYVCFAFLPGNIYSYDANLFNKSALVGKLDPEHNIPDHSVLSWQFMFTDYVDNSRSDHSFVVNKFDVTQIPDNFLTNPFVVNVMNQIKNRKQKI